MARVTYVEDTGGLAGYNIFKTLAHSPEVLKGYADLGGRLLFGDAIDARTRELIINAIAARLRSEYEWSWHVGMGRDAGVTDAELIALRDGGWEELLPSRERACVDYALKVEGRAVTDADVEALRAEGLGDGDIVALTVLAGFYGMTARYLQALAVDIDEGNPGFEAP